MIDWKDEWYKADDRVQRFIKWVLGEKEEGEK
jgi:hypothetical protein